MPSWCGILYRPEYKVGLSTNSETSMSTAMTKPMATAVKRDRGETTATAKRARKKTRAKDTGLHEEVGKRSTCSFHFHGSTSGSRAFLKTFLRGTIVCTIYSGSNRGYITDVMANAVGTITMECGRYHYHVMDVPAPGKVLSRKALRSLILSSHRYQSMNNLCHHGHRT